MLPKPKNIETANIYAKSTATSTVSPSWCFVAPSISIHSSNHQIYDSFQFKDHVTHQKIKLRTLHSSSQSPIKSRNKSKKFIWTDQIYQQQKEEKIKYLQCLMTYIEEIKNIRDNRNSALLDNWKVNKPRTDNQGNSTDQSKINIRKSVGSQQSDSTKTINLRSSIDEKIVKEKKIMEQMNRKIYQINIQQFRKYYRKENQFNPQNQNLMNLAKDFCRALPLKSGAKKDVIKKPKNNNDLKEKIKEDYDCKFEAESSLLNKLIRMRFIHETHFNWQKGRV